ncbi:thioredoxin domain-containing protein [Estrella lausannensis]|uniref:Spermatogenesis-associated protein 20-like TRX domain-containing protein n=1 Tax=Estrella lausannensis TaxID=483423 RepID=A0A0H5DPX6_9BACT|nr:thioredoxin domain-containing protein [Estrella lausannensis]CRX38656.1 Conserved hypothetical protein [Estrella lausannensis]
MPSDKTKPNRLINEKSTYLQQHAYNPVEWFPWGQEAFDLSKRLDRPIFLSIGYATCHWCHVMEKESFEDPEVAKVLNEIFVCVKVDREELPDIDSMYMEFAQSMMSGSAGWPLNLVLTPDLHPFFATTYMPPIARHGMLGVIEMAKRIQTIWEGEEREGVTQKAERIVEVFRQNVHVKGDEIPDENVIENTVEMIYKLADPIWGGMRGSPKFPIGYQYNFMTRHACLSNDSRPLFFVQRTLEMMHRGGIFDHLGGGFARYSVDERWQIPHFEKMLYDNSLLLSSYTEGYMATKNEEFKEVALETADYLLRDMWNDKGGFSSAEDADSEGKEGYFYTFDYEEVMQAIGQEEGALFAEYFGITKNGNFEGRNVLHVQIPFNEFASHKGIEPGLLKELFSLQRKTLFEIRDARVHPIKDDKVLSSWNGLAIASLSDLGRVCQRKDCIEFAAKAASFILENMVRDDSLYRRWKDGELKWPGGLDEYAYFIKGLLSLFEATQNTRWLVSAINFAEVVKERFKEEGGAFFQTEEETSVLIRKCQFADGAEPSGNGVHAENLLRLYQLTQNADYLHQAEDIFKAAAKFLEAYSPGYCYHVMALLRYYDHDAPTIIVALNESEDFYFQLKKTISTLYIPHALVLFINEDDSLGEWLPMIRGKEALQGRTTLYICREGVCEKPITDFDEMLLSLHRL